MATSKGDRGENNKMNCRMDTTGEEEKRMYMKKWMEGVKASMTTRYLVTDQWRNGVWIPEDGDSC